MNNRLAKAMLLTMILMVLALEIFLATGLPEGVVITYNETDNITPAAAAAITTAGGSFTTMNLNVSQQNSRWKAYVGNVSGDLQLRDNNNYTIYDWDLVTVTGEVYASRSNDITWANIQCLTNATLLSEEDFMNITTSAVDSINLTFNNTVHAGFWVGNKQITNSTCRAIATYVNNQAQVASETADFQEILLDDTSNFVYSTILEQDQAGYDSGKTFDFQMILAEDEYASTPTTYYFYAELG
ncbi:MAG: hypothetical protein ABH828_03440 [archaeon]